MRLLLAVSLVALLVAGCGSCPPGVDANAENVRIIVEDNELLLEQLRLAGKPRSENETADIRLHNGRSVENARKLVEVCR